MPTFDLPVIVNGGKCALLLFCVKWSDNCDGFIGVHHQELLLLEVRFVSFPRVCVFAVAISSNSQRTWGLVYMQSRTYRIQMSPIWISPRSLSHAFFFVLPDNAHNFDNHLYAQSPISFHPPPLRTCLDRRRSNQAPFLNANACETPLHPQWLISLAKTHTHPAQVKSKFTLHQALPSLRWGFLRNFIQYTDCWIFQYTHKKTINYFAAHTKVTRAMQFDA